MVLSDRWTHSAPIRTFREVVEEMMGKYGDHLVMEVSFQNEIIEIPSSSGLYREHALTGAVELYFSLDVRRPELVPWANRTDPSDQSGDYESTPDLNALIEERVVG